MLQAIREGIMHLFYPRLCYGCTKPLTTGEDVLCLHCALQLPVTGYHHIADNETALRFAGRFPFAHATSYAHFTNDGLLQHMLHGLKYRNRKDIGYYLGQQLALDVSNAGWVREIDAIIPVPLHPKKEALRGYNQSALIADGLGGMLQLPVLKNVLLRNRHTESQTQKTRAQRLENMHQAFAVSSSKIGQARHVLLVDDVLTTGATLEACALALLETKDIAVSIATIGIAH